MSNYQNSVAIDSLESSLRKLNIGYKEYHHQPLATCFQADEIGLERSGKRTKHLFLRDNPGKKHFLVLTSSDKSIDLKILSKQLKVSRLGFASETRLKSYLGVERGCVSLLSLFNDLNRDVVVIVDQSLWSHQYLQLHPLINTKTWVLKRTDIQKWLCFLEVSFYCMSLPAFKENQVFNN